MLTTKGQSHPHDMPVQAQRVGGIVALTHLQPQRSKRADGQHHAPAALKPGKNRYPLYRRLAGPRGGLDGEPKISSPTGLDPKTILRAKGPKT
jgi:hypothetical protein